MYNDHYEWCQQRNANIMHVKHNNADKSSYTDQTRKFSNPCRAEADDLYFCWKKFGWLPETCQ